MTYPKLMWGVIKKAVVSTGRFVGLVGQKSLHLRRARVGTTYKINQTDPYTVFRETVCSKEITDRPVVLIVGFRLKLLRSNPVLHWLFQRGCILTTPFWSGFRGFKVKLWMVDPKAKNYLGIYQWLGRDNAQVYARSLMRVLRPLSTNASVWYEIHSQMFDDYLQRHSVTSLKDVSGKGRQKESTTPHI